MNNAGSPGEPFPLVCRHAREDAGDHGVLQHPRPQGLSRRPDQARHLHGEHPVSGLDGHRRRVARDGRVHRERPRPHPGVPPLRRGAGQAPRGQTLHGQARGAQGDGRAVCPGDPRGTHGREGSLRHQDRLCRQEERLVRDPLRQLRRHGAGEAHELSHHHALAEVVARREADLVSFLQGRRPGPVRHGSQPPDDTEDPLHRAVSIFPPPGRPTRSGCS